MSLTIYGKALMVMTRLDTGPGKHCWHSEVYIQSCSGSLLHRDSAREELWNVDYDILPAPGPAYKMEIGETIRLSVNFLLTYHRYFDGEVDVDLEYPKVRVLRRQKAPKYYTGKEHATHSS